MSWNSCRQCVFIPRSCFTSALFKVLVTLKLLHGSRTGARGSTLEDIAMHMIKHFCLDGDVKSQVLASLKFGVKMHFIQKRKDKFSLIMPASSIHLAPCKYKNEETERIQCIFPSAWYSSGGNTCHETGDSGCGKRRRPLSKPSCHSSDDEAETDTDICCSVSQDRQKKPRSSSSKCCPPCAKKQKIKRPKNLCKHNKPSRSHKPDCAQDIQLNTSKYPHDAPRNCRCCNK